MTVRDWCLAGMGVVQYLPREHYCGADAVIASESITALSEPQENLTAPADLPQLSSTRLTPPLLQNITDELVETVAEAAYQPAAGATPGETLAVAELTTRLTFRLACWQPTDDLLLIDSLEPGETVDSARSMLLANLVLALRNAENTRERPAENKRQIMQAELIDWPDAAGDSSVAGAKAMLAAFIEARIKMRGVRRVIVMGATAARLLDHLAVEDPAEKPLRRLPGDARACFAPALIQMLHDPANKALAWRAIRQLV